MKKNRLAVTSLTAITLLSFSCGLFTSSKQTLVEKIDKIIKPLVEKIESDKKEEELTSEQVKKIFLNIQKNDDLSKDYRRQFYSSLEYNKIRITSLIEILNKFDTNKDELKTLIRAIIDRGSIFVQNPLEIAVLDISKRKDDLINFNSKEKLNDIKNKLNKILGMQQQWIKNIDKIIITYNDNKNLQEKIEDLKAYIKTTYENTLKPDSNEIYDLMIEIGRELQENL
ncbi:hypothetical protein OY14_04680 (plasmid) [Borreliella chilensis]|uniref:Lipoprotein n=1 Tax=Borreliella chilensis TaxID=1245910 RepID=A0A0A7UZ99_9SPIR|nr:hypothetical protein OY14_04680 [Borreliella chilensis]